MGHLLRRYIYQSYNHLKIRISCFVVHHNQLFSIMVLQGIHNLLLTIHLFFLHPLSHVDFMSVLLHLFHCVCIHRIADKCLNTGAPTITRTGVQKEEEFQSSGQRACVLLYHVQCLWG